MKIETTPLELDNCFSAKLANFEDSRGSFLKLFHDATISAFLPNFLPREAYLTTSAKGVLRGMHFQLPPDDHSKIVIALSGRVTDVLLDLRKGGGYGKWVRAELSPQGINAMLIPKGVAHGFYAHEDNSALLYLVETVHSPNKDAGIHWNSFGYEWPTSKPILSDRDQNHKPLKAFSSPF